jgi:hypothetical protein
VTVLPCSICPGLDRGVQMQPHLPFFLLFVATSLSLSPTCHHTPPLPPHHPHGARNTCTMLTPQPLAVFDGNIGGVMMCLTARAPYRSGVNQAADPLLARPPTDSPALVYPPMSSLAALLSLRFVASSAPSSLRLRRRGGVLTRTATTTTFHQLDDVGEFSRCLPELTNCTR